MQVSIGKMSIQEVMVKMGTSTNFSRMIRILFDTVNENKEYTGVCDQDGMLIYGIRTDKGKLLSWVDFINSSVSVGNLVVPEKPPGMMISYEKLLEAAKIKYPELSDKDAITEMLKEFQTGAYPVVLPFQRPNAVIDGRPCENIDEVIAVLLPRFAGMEKHASFMMGEASFAAFCHSQLSGGIGMKIRNEFQLWDDNSILHRYFVKELGLKHADEMSDRIIREVYKKMNEKI